MSIQISQISLENVQSFHLCLDTVAQERRYLAQTRALPLEQIESFVRDSVSSDAVQFVALDGDRVIGWADIFASWAEAISHRGSLGMGVLPEYRGQGIGERLLRACIEKAQEKGITRVELETRADNFPSIKLYEKLGFVRETEKEKAMLFDGEYHNSIQMSLLL